MICLIVIRRDEYLLWATQTSGATFAIYTKFAVHFFDSASQSRGYEELQTTELAVQRAPHDGLNLGGHFGAL